MSFNVSAATVVSAALAAQKQEEECLNQLLYRIHGMCKPYSLEIVGLEVVENSVSNGNPILVLVVKTKTRHMEIKLNFTYDSNLKFFQIDPASCGDEDPLPKSIISLCDDVCKAFNL